MTRHKTKTYFNLLQKIYWVVVLSILNSTMILFHRPIEERIEPLLIPTMEL